MAVSYTHLRSVKCSNFIGETIDMAADMGFKRMLLTGHIGKLIKVDVYKRQGFMRGMELLPIDTVLKDSKTRLQTSGEIAQIGRASCRERV